MARMPQQKDRSSAAAGSPRSPTPRSPSSSALREDSAMRVTFGAGRPASDRSSLAIEMRGHRQRHHQQERLEGQRLHFLMGQPAGEHIHRAARILDVETRNRHEDAGEICDAHAGERERRQIGMNAALERIRREGGAR